MNKNTKIILALLGAAVAASALAVFLKQGQDDLGIFIHDSTSTSRSS